MKLVASEEECRALASRFQIEKILTLDAEVDLEASGQDASAQGQVIAEVEQICAVTGEPFVHQIDEELNLLFVPVRTYAASNEDDPLEVELDFEDADEIEYEGDGFDIGEAVAQTLALAIDPYAEGPGAATYRAKIGLSDDQAPRGPLAEMLKGLSRQ